MSDWAPVLSMGVLLHPEYAYELRLAVEWPIIALQWAHPFLLISPIPKFPSSHHTLTQSGERFYTALTSPLHDCIVPALILLLFLSVWPFA